MNNLSSEQVKPHKPLSLTRKPLNLPNYTQCTTYRLSKRARWQATFVPARSRRSQTGFLDGSQCKDGIEGTRRLQQALVLRYMGNG